MQEVHDPAELDRHKQVAVLVLFGGAGCGVCQALKPKLQEMLADEFPALGCCYLDCQGAASAVCAQEGVFSLPVVQVWFDGRKFAQFGRVFSLGQLRDAIERPYRIAFG